MFDIELFENSAVRTTAKVVVSKATSKLNASKKTFKVKTKSKKSNWNLKR